MYTGTEGLLFHHKSQITNLAAKVETNKQQVVTLLTAAKQQEAAEADRLVKVLKLIQTIQKLEPTITPAVWDKMEQLGGGPTVYPTHTLG